MDVLTSLPSPKLTHVAMQNGHKWHQISSGLSAFRHYNEAGRYLEWTLLIQREALQQQRDSAAAYDLESHAEFGEGPHQRDDSTTTSEKLGSSDDESIDPEDDNSAWYDLLLQVGHIQAPAEGESSDSIVVRFGENDPFDPMAWSNSRKALYTAIVGAIGLLTMGAAAFESGINPQASAEFHTSQVVELLSTAVYMISFGAGTLISAPFSETLGRNPVYLFGLVFFMLCTIGVALATNVQTQLVMRFFMGLFGSPPAVTFGGSISDLWSPLERVWVFPALSFLTFLGPFVAPVVANYIATSPLKLSTAGAGGNWHFIEWLTLIISAAILLGIGLCSRETYAPVLLSWKAQHLRRITGDQRYKAPTELNHPGLGKSLLYSLRRPWIFLFKETIVALFSLYLVVIYVVLFGSLVAYNYIFGRTGEAIYYLSQREVGLTYLPMNVGFLLALLPLPWLYRAYKHKLAIAQENGVERLQPEEHLWYAMLEAPLLPLSLLWLALSSKPDLSYWSDLVASAFFGFASLAIFVTCYQYIIDSYEEFAASALVGMTFTRYVASAPIVVAADYMYAHMGVRNAEMVWFAVAAVLMPVPYLFYWYGPAIRSKSTRATDFGAEYRPEPKALVRKIKDRV